LVFCQALTGVLATGGAMRRALHHPSFVLAAVYQVAASFPAFTRKKRGAALS